MLLELISRHRIIAMSTPWMTTADPADTKPKAFKYPILFKGFQGIM
jgi:hypothetical protein